MIQVRNGKASLSVWNRGKRDLAGAYSQGMSRTHDRDKRLKWLGIALLLVGVLYLLGAGLRQGFQKGAEIRQQQGR